MNCTNIHQRAVDLLINRGAFYKFSSSFKYHVWYLIPCLHITFEQYKNGDYRSRDYIIKFSFLCAYIELRRCSYKK